MQLSRQTIDSHLLIAIDKQNNMHIISPQTNILYIMPCHKGIGSRHKSGTGNNQGRQWTNLLYNWCFNYSGCNSKSNELSLPVISISHPFNNSVINPYQLSSVRQHSSSSSHNTPRDNWCFNSKDSNLKRNKFPSLVIPVPPPLNDSVINLNQMSLVCQKLSISPHNTTHEFQASSIPGRTSTDPSNTMPPPSTNNGSRNIYGCMVYVSRLTLVQQQQHAVMLIQHYHKFCKTNDPSSMFLSRMYWYKLSFIIWTRSSNHIG